MNDNTPLSSLNGMVGVLIPSNDLYIKILSTYVLISFLMGLYLIINKNRNQKIYLITFKFYNFMLPISETLFQLLAIVAGFFVTLAIGASITTSFSIISYLATALYIFFLAFVVIATKNFFQKNLETGNTC